MKSKPNEVLNNLKPILVDVTVKGVRPRAEAVRCVVGENLEFDTASMESYFFEDWEPVLYDALLLAAAIEFCDKTFRRPTEFWGRYFDLIVPVHEPERWSQPNVLQSLIEALNFLTGDRWNIKFIGRRDPQVPPLKQLHFKLEPDVAAVIPFSNGLDSQAVAGLMGLTLGTRLALIRLQPNQDHRGQNFRRAFTAVPVHVKNTNRRFSESSARSRGFKFAIVSGLAAYLSKANTVILPESGQGALGPALIPVGQVYEDYRCHPLFTKRMEKFLHALLGAKVEFKIPRIWNTKGETVRQFVEQCKDQSKSWKATRSCWQQNRQSSVNGKWRHCGICAACLLRRMSIHSAGLAEPNNTYVWENLSAETFLGGAAKEFPAGKITNSLKEYAIAGVLFLDHLSGLGTSVLAKQTLKLRAKQLASSLEIKEEEAQANLGSLLENHRKEWNGFLESIGPRSFISKWTTQRHL
jgi:7-cyano-7-deazaguanine synthase in queuosine biosynthesis